jgi:hypothetical protein
MHRKRRIMRNPPDGATGRVYATADSTEMAAAEKHKAPRTSTGVFLRAAARMLADADIAACTSRSTDYETDP